jgi:hypothetical protein
MTLDPLHSSSTKMARMISFLRTHKRILVFSLIVAYAAFRVAHPDEDGRFFDLFFIALLVMLIASQLFWIRRILDLDLGERLIPGKPGRAWLAVIAGAVYVFFFAYSLTHRGVANFLLPAMDLIGAPTGGCPAF